MQVAYEGDPICISRLLTDLKKAALIDQDRASSWRCGSWWNKDSYKGDVPQLTQAWDEDNLQGDVLAAGDSTWNKWNCSRERSRGERLSLRLHVYLLLGMPVRRLQYFSFLSTILSWWCWNVLGFCAVDRQPANRNGRPGTYPWKSISVWYWSIAQRIICIPGIVSCFEIFKRLISLLVAASNIPNPQNSSSSCTFGG